jgi:DNA polymerase bacteriophage-type
MGQLDHSCQVQRATHAERGVDLYETPDVAVEALLRVEKIPYRVWEPACGPGRIVNVLRAHGHEVIASDLIDYGTDPTAIYGRDFLKEQQAPEDIGAILTNPPYKWAEEFVRRALELSPRIVIMLLRLAFLESERRRDILENCGLARIHQFRKRLPMMHRAGWEGKKANSGMAFAWFVWDREHSGPPTVQRISWETPETPAPVSKKARSPVAITAATATTAPVAITIAPVAITAAAPVAITTATATSTGHHVLHRDYETRGLLDLKAVGVHLYAADSRTEVLCCGFAVDDGPVKLWTPGQPVPPEFIEAASNPDWTAVAHAASFEMAIEEHIMAPRYGWPLIPLERQRCTMAAAQALALPARLEAVAAALDLEQQKDAAGHRLMLQMTRPRRAHKDEDPNSVLWFEDQARLERLYEYCQQDIRTERELHARLRPLSLDEQQIWQLDSIINTRGFHVDRPLAEAARRIVEAAGPEIDAELAELTNKAATTIGQVEKIRTWLEAQGYKLKTLDKKAVEATLDDPELPPNVRRVLELRQEGGGASAKKIDALLSGVGADGRVRGTLRYHGASTGRWSGQRFQPQNLRRISGDPVDLEARIAAVATGDYAQVAKLYPKPLAVVGDISRPLICAAPGHVLIGADFSSVESRVLAWAAGEEWKVESYRHYDATQDPAAEPYCLTGCKILRLPAGSITPETHPVERGVGKVADLALGYMGSVAAWRKFDSSDRYNDEQVKQLVQDWRAAHPRIKQFWFDLDRAAWNALHERGGIMRCGSVAFCCTGAFLFMKLPSGRLLAYPHPHIKVADDRTAVVFMDNSSGRWSECRNGRGAYGATWSENLTQAICRDLLTAAMLRIEEAGFPIVLTVHDEIVCEVPEGSDDIEKFTQLMTRVPSWAPTLPIAAKAWSGARYCK